MNKPIIIDGVDVSGCVDYDDGTCCNERVLTLSCENYQDCLYKQLQRLKAENEELKQYKQSKQASYETMQTEWNKAINESRDVKAENEKYKQALEEVREIVDKACKKCKNDEFGEDYCIGSEFCALAEINEVLKDDDRT